MCLCFLTHRSSAVVSLSVIYDLFTVPLCLSHASLDLLIVGMINKATISGPFTFLRCVEPKRILGSAVLTITACLWASAQSDLDEVRILPRTTSVSAVSSATVVRSNVDLVLLNVTVLDRADRAVTGLQQTDFAVFDDNKPQAVTYISNVDEPASVVIVFDASARHGYKD